MMSKDRRQGWLAELKVGDKVIVTSNCTEHVGVVDNISPTGRLRISGSQYDHTGSLMGTRRGYRRLYLIQASDKRIENLDKKRHIESIVRSLDWIMREQGSVNHMKRIDGLDYSLIKEFNEYLEKYNNVVRIGNEG